MNDTEFVVGDVVEVLGNYPTDENTKINPIGKRGTVVGVRYFVRVDMGFSFEGAEDTHWFFAPNEIKKVDSDAS